MSPEIMERYAAIKEAGEAIAELEKEKKETVEAAKARLSKAHGNFISS